MVGKELIIPLAPSTLSESAVAFYLGMAEEFGMLAELSIGLNSYQAGTSATERPSSTREARNKSA